MNIEFKIAVDGIRNSYQQLNQSAEYAVEAIYTAHSEIENLKSKLSKLQAIVDGYNKDDALIVAKTEKRILDDLNRKSLTQLSNNIKTAELSGAVTKAVKHLSGLLPEDHPFYNKRVKKWDIENIIQDLRNSLNKEQS